MDFRRSSTKRAGRYKMKEKSTASKPRGHFELNSTSDFSFDAITKMSFRISVKRSRSVVFKAPGLLFFVLYTVANFRLNRVYIDPNHFNVFAPGARDLLVGPSVKM